MEQFVQFLSVLFSLSDFGVSANVKAPAPAEVTKYGVEDADVFLYVDLEPNLAKNYRAFVALKDKAAVKDAPEIREVVERAVAAAEQGRAQAKATIGIDPVTDLKSVAVWVQIGSGETTGLIAVRGKFPPAWLDGMAASHLFGPGGPAPRVGGTFEVDGQKALQIDDVALARTADGQVLVGTRALVEARLKRNWKGPAAKPGSAAAEVRAALAERPIASALFKPSATARQQIAMKNADDRFATDLLAGLSSARFSLLHNGVSWRHVATDKNAYEAAVLASEGLLDLMRSSHFFGRGFARLVLAGVRIHLRSVPALAPIVAREKDLLRLVNQVTGDGRFAASVNRSPAKNTVTVRATGRSLSAVIPAASLLPLFGAGAWLGLAKRSEVTPPEASSAPPAIAPAPRPSDRPLDVRGVYQRAKKKHAR